MNCKLFDRVESCKEFVRIIVVCLIELRSVRGLLGDVSCLIELRSVRSLLGE